MVNFVWIVPIATKFSLVAASSSSVLHGSMLNVQPSGMHVLWVIPFFDLEQFLEERLVVLPVERLQDTSSKRSKTNSPEARNSSDKRARRQ